MHEHFGFRPTSFRNTDLIYNEAIAKAVADMGYKSIICERRTDMFEDDHPAAPDQLMRAQGTNLIVIPRNREISEDIRNRYQNGVLRSGEFSEWLSRAKAESVLLAYDCAQVREDFWEDKNLFSLWRELAVDLSKHEGVRIVNPSDIAEQYADAEIPEVRIQSGQKSRHDELRKDSMGWLSTDAQFSLFSETEELEAKVRKAGKENQTKWRYLTTSDQIQSLSEREPGAQDVHAYQNPYKDGPMAAYVLTRKMDGLVDSVRHFYILKKAEQTPVIIIAPETGRLPEQGMGEQANLISGKTGGMGEVVAAICYGLSERQIPAYFVGLNLRRRFMDESGLTETEWIQKRHRLDPESIKLVNSAIFADNRSAYDGNPVETAAEYQKQIVNTIIRDIRSKHSGRGIVHTHDWMAGGAILAYCHARGIPSLHTVHNTHTRDIPLDLLRGVNLGILGDHMHIAGGKGNMMDSQATAIKSADLVSYVGESFLKEVVDDYFTEHAFIPWSVRHETKHKYGLGSAIVVPNGISPVMYPENQKADPDLDAPGLAQSYGPNSPDLIQAKRANLAKFQKQMGLKFDPDAILLFWSSRLDPTQKGPEHLLAVAQRVAGAHPEVQIGVVANGDAWYESRMGQIACASNGKIAFRRFDEKLSILGYAACADSFGASLYEPFGQNDVVGNLYGATATNRDTGGYHDKITTLRVKSWGATRDHGNGFLFRDYNSVGLEWGLNQSIAAHKRLRQEPAEYERQMRRIMRETRENWGLDNMIASYITAYQRLNENRPLA
jgi:glycogen synthase